MKILKKAFVLVVFIMTCVMMQAQESRLSIGFAGSLNFMPKQETVLAFDYHNYRPHAGYSIGQMMQYQLGKRHFIQFGAYHSRRSYFISFDFYQHLPDSIGGDRLVPSYTAHVKVDYLDIPLSMGYRVWEKGKWAFTPSLGINMRILMNEKPKIHYHSEASPEYYYYAHPPSHYLLRVGVQANLGIEYNLTDKLFLLAQPFFRYEVLGLDTSSTGKTPKNYGANLSINFRL